MTPDIERELRLRTLAGVAERRNRPLRYIFFAGALLVIAGIFALVSLNGAGQARARLERQADQHAEVIRIVNEIESIRTAGRRTDLAARYPPEPGLLGKLEAIHQRLGMDNAPQLTESRSLPLRLDSPFFARSVRARLSDVPLSQAMLWINEAQTTIPGLRVSSVDFRPTPQGWIVEVNLTRWELRT